MAKTKADKPGTTHEYECQSTVVILAPTLAHETTAVVIGATATRSTIGRLGPDGHRWQIFVTGTSVQIADARPRARPRDRVPPLHPAGFGGSRNIGDMSHPSSARTAGDATVLAWDGPTFPRLVTADSVFALRVFQQTAVSLAQQAETLTAGLAAMRDS